ncbi:uncharacterized protein [Centroberyx affinis]|uniref:uncharacterized protein n=1 Tax=Centroberyx affinis TaxID=166261 RepID=UPI003A5C664C
MATENTDTNTGAEEEKAALSEPNEHDYANTASSTSTEPSSDPPAADGEVPPQNSVLQPAPPDQSEPGQSASNVAPAELPEPSGGENYAGTPPPEDPQTKTCEPEPAAARPPEERSCCCCKSEFERQGRHFNRRSVFTFTTPDTVQWVFPDAAVHAKSFLCEGCVRILRSKTKRKQSGKRSMWLRPPPAKQAEARDKRRKVQKLGKKSRAALLVSKARYGSALKTLWTAKGARRSMMDFWSKLVREEMKALSRDADSPFQQKVSCRKPLSSFPWQRCLEWAESKAPLVTSCLRSFFPDTNTLSKRNSQLSEEQAQTLLARRTVVTLSVPLFTRNIWRNNFLQAAVGAELRLQGCSGPALDALNTMGLCQNKDTVRLRLHRISNAKKTTTQNGRQKKKLKEEQVRHVEEEEEEEEEGEVEEEVGEEEEEEEPVEEEKVEKGKKRKKKAKKQRRRKEGKRKERGKRKAKEREEEEDEEEEEEEEEEGSSGSSGSEQKKRRVVVVRLDLLKGHSEVGRSDLSAP